MKAAAMSFPAAFSISAPAGETDYSVCARDLAVAVKFAYRINAEINEGGRTLLSGWHEAASASVIFFVSCPRNAEAAFSAVENACRELSATLRLFIGTPDHLRPIMTGLPLGFRKVGASVIVEAKRPRNVAYVADWITSVGDAWRGQIAAWEQFFAAETATGIAA